MATCTIEEYKSKARRLGAFLSARDEFKGVEVQHSVLLHAVAAAEGFRSWQVLLADAGAVAARSSTDLPSVADAGTIPEGPKVDSAESAAPRGAILPTEVSTEDTRRHSTLYCKPRAEIAKEHLSFFLAVAARHCASGVKAKLAFRAATSTFEPGYPCWVWLGACIAYYMNEEATVAEAFTNVGFPPYIAGLFSTHDGNLAGSLESCAQLIEQSPARFEFRLPPEEIRRSAISAYLGQKM